jgi:hypothetical protein
MTPPKKAEIKEFVEAAHGNLARVKVMLEANPQLLNLPNGRETALGAACQMRRKDIIEFLLSQGAEMDLYAACVLGDAEAVRSFLDADPERVHAKAAHAHGKKPLYFAAEQPEVAELLTIRGAK